MRESNNNSYMGSRFFSVALALYPILAMYGFGAVSFGDIVLILALFTTCGEYNELLVTSRKPIQIQWLFLLYCIMGLFFSQLFYDKLLFVSVVKRILKQGFYIFIVSQCPKLLNQDTFIKTYRKLVYITFAGLIIQYLAYYVFGFALVLKIPFLPYSGTVTVNDIYSKLSWQFRPGAFYSEPAACSYVLLPFLPYSLLKTQTGKRRLYDIIVCTVAILMTVSSAGMICCVIIYLCYIVNLIFNSSISLAKRFMSLIGIGIILMIVFYIFMRTPLSNSFIRLVDKENALMTQNVWGKTSQGEDLFATLSTELKLFGIGFGNIDMSSLSNYTNGVYYILCCTGYIGFVIMIFWLLTIIIKTKVAGKITACVFAALCVSARVVISSAMMFFCVFCILDDKNLENFTDVFDDEIKF